MKKNQTPSIPAELVKHENGSYTYKGFQVKRIYGQPGWSIFEGNKEVEFCVTTLAKCVRLINEKSN